MSKRRSSNDDRSDSMNPNNPAYQDSLDNRSDQLNPNNEKYRTCWDVIKEYVDKLPEDRTPQKKMILIDTIIYECHKWLNKETKEYLYHRPLAVNLIQGKETKIIELLTSLAEGKGNSAEVKERLVIWKKKDW